MYNADLPSRDELPSSARLIRSTILAAIVASVLLVTVVMPAEYAIDPTGVGRLLGLTEMGEIKAHLAEEAAADETLTAGSQFSAVVPPDSAAEEAQSELAPHLAKPDPEATVEEPAVQSGPDWRDEVVFTLAPGQGTEYKLTMEEGAAARFSWVSEGGAINYDTHGDGGGKSISYKKGRGVPEEAGELVAAFSGNHGWFFRNRNSNEVRLTLRTSGAYGTLKKMK